MGPTASATSDAGSVAHEQRKVRTFPGKAQLPGRYHRWRSAAAAVQHVNINGSAYGPLQKEEREGKRREEGEGREEGRTDGQRQSVKPPPQLCQQM